jgi:LysR family transcriptional regulator, low CO2-responsive transcriptional regulator
VIDLDKLNAFLHASQTLSFSAAAQQLHVSQPTISKYISALEHEFDVALFERTSGGLQLTAAGKTLVPWAHRLVHESLDMHEMMLSMRGEVIGQLQIACSTTAGKYILPQLAGRFRHLHAGVRISILACTQEHVAVRLLDGEADLGVVSMEVDSSQLECQEFFTDYLDLIVPASHPWAGRMEIEPGELLEVPIILREPQAGTRRAMLSALARHDITLSDLDVFLEVGNAEAIVGAVTHNFGVSFVSRLASSYARSTGCVVDVPVAGINLTRQLCMARPSMKAPTRAVEAFWSFVHHPANDDLFELAAY